MLWSEAVDEVWKRAEALRLRDDWGDLLSGQEVMAKAVPPGEYEALKYELEKGLMTPEAYISWSVAYIEAYARKRARRRTERLLMAMKVKP
jgi:hypothetical protein